jgi:hypothetical protein
LIHFVYVNGKLQYSCRISLPVNDSNERDKYSVLQSQRENASGSAGSMSCLSLKPKFHYLLHKNPSMMPILSHINPFLYILLNSTISQSTLNNHLSLYDMPLHVSASIWPSSGRSPKKRNTVMANFLEDRQRPRRELVRTPAK